MIEHGPTLLVNIGFDRDFVPGGPIPIASHTNELAIVDTGATECGVDEDVAAAAKLPLIDTVLVGTANGPAMLNVYLAQVLVQGLGLLYTGRFGGMKLRAGGAKQSVLLGRDLLQHVLMTYDGRSGQVEVVY